MNTRTRYLIILFFISINVFGNDFQINKVLAWNDSIKSIPTFNDAVYFNSTGNVPYFSGVLHFSYYPKPSFIINNLEKKNVNVNVFTNVSTFLKTNNVAFEFVVEKTGSTYLLKYWYPAIQKNEIGEIFRISKIDFTISVENTGELKSSKSNISLHENSKLASGKWYKFEVSKNGVYKITKAYLSNLGIAVNKSIRVFTFPKNVNHGFNTSKMYDDLYECSIFSSNNGSSVFGVNDYVLFYGEAADSWSYSSNKAFFDHNSNLYSVNNYYYILVDDDLPLSIPEINNSNIAQYETSSFDNYEFHENDDYNIQKSGKEWFESLPASNIKFNLTNFIDDSIFFKIRTVSESSSTFSLGLLNGSDYLKILNSKKDATSYFTSKVSSTSLKLQLSDINSFSTAKAYLDDIVINYRSKLVYDGKQILFRDKKTINFAHSKYVISSNKNVIVWNITDVLNPKQIFVTNNSEKKEIIYSSDTLETFVAFNESDCFVPKYKGEVQNQNLHSYKNVDMIIVTANNFELQANKLKELHYNTDGLQSVVVTQDQVFNEFSGGRPCPDAIKDFARYIYNMGGNKLSFLMLFGDGSYDNRNLNTNKEVITFESNASVDEGSSIVTDDFFALLDEGEGISDYDQIIGAIDLAVGRIPVSTVEDADVVTNKIINYCSGNNSRGDWRNRMLFVADDADDYTIHMDQANELADKCIGKNTNLITDKVFLDAYPQVSIAGGQRYPTVNKTIESKIKNGCLIFNYTGHGNPLRLAGEIVTDKSEVDKWQNTDALPLFITAACEVGRFDDETRLSLGENILLSNHGGGIALFTTTRKVYSDQNMELNANVYDYMFSLTTDNKPQFMGHILRLAKNDAVTDTYNKHNFVMLGDPAVRIALPIFNVKTDKVNGYSTDVKIDTLKALSNITITGHIDDFNGIKQSTYNGTIHAVVFDKPQNITTLSNDGNKPITYKAQINILFKGKATVQNGDFTFSFIVPKDIFYFYGNGRISYYVDNGAIDGAGSFNQFVIGGSSTYSFEKNGGPEINLFMNDTNFVYGGITNASPTLLIQAKDSYGINVSGTAVGHDATATFDGSKSEQIVLNQFYETDKNTYQKGFFKYPVSSISEGKHSVDVKVWNINNEVTQKYLEFYVESSASLALQHVLNYPNPFTTATSFYFEHNQSNQQLDVLVQIYTVSGKLVKTISSIFYSEGNRSLPITWDGKDDYGDPIGRGVYVYKIRVQNEKNEIAQKYEKLVLLK